MQRRLAPVLLTLAGVVHLATLVVLALPGRARPVTAGDAVFLIGFGGAYLLAAWALARGFGWGRWLGLVLSGVEAVPGAVLVYVLLVFSADPGRRGSSGVFWPALLLAPLVVFVVLWRHRARPG